MYSQGSWKIAELFLKASTTTSSVLFLRLIGRVPWSNTRGPLSGFGTLYTRIMIGPTGCWH